MTSVENVVCVVSALEESKCSDWQSMEDDYDLHSRWLAQAIQACKAKIAESYGLPIETIESELNSPTIPINHDDNKETLPESKEPEETTSSSPSSEQEVAPPVEPTLTKGDVMAMKVAELREELLCRGMATSGLKKDLQGRLLEVVLEEQELYLVAVEQQRQIQLEREEQQKEQEEKEFMEQQQMDKEKEREVETQETEENVVEEVVDVDVVEEDDVKMDTVEEQPTADVDMDDVVESNQHADEYPYAEESTENHGSDEYPTMTNTTDHEDASREPRPSTEPTNASKHDDQDISMEDAEANDAPTDNSYPSNKSNPSPIDTNIPTESTTTITATAIAESKPMDTDVNMNEIAEPLQQQQQSQPKGKTRLGKKIIKLFSPKRKDKHGNGFTSPKSIHNKANNKKSPKYSPKNTTTASRNHEIIQDKEGTTTTNSSPYKRDSIICPMNTDEIKEVHSSVTASKTTQHKNDNKSTNTDSTTNNSLQSKPLKTSTESTATATSASSSINSQSVPPKLKAYKEARQARLAEIRGKVTSAKKPTATATAGTGKPTTTASTSTNSTTTNATTATTATRSDKGERKRALAAQMRQKAAAEVVTKKTAFTSKSTLKPTPSKPTAIEGDDRIMDAHVSSSTYTADVVSEDVPTKSSTMTTPTPSHTSHTSHKTIHSTNTNTKTKSTTTTTNTTTAATTPSTHATHLGQAAANALLKKKVLSPMDTYEMSDRDGSSDEEESEDEYEKSPKKKIPKWAHKANLIPALEKQFLPGPNRLDPDEIFPEVSTCDLEAIFDQKKKRYTKRTSSGNWTNDCVTVPERMVYKRNMGFKK